ncbi:MAG: Crossover junction endodeoxyribonuclease RuvC [Candidatus Gottesmanbacteria bacterium GW2011_GWA2_44_17]|uniref:Crossover junction endodeoxyribonuclease RuvC n=3 Tax=Candidatus Gottesmaniibacteriota TaxID=1752720 RepID=A0A0G1KLZ3_9BACT|nr:MAG: Holliday junction resolvase, crossover junction endodeoxyribonuclease RuvC [Microgenomates group bacterium GW2011_GWC1_43_11]KKT36660.1 MAG: Crossover junction endodeoxyribonuclease RuvC [Candidatus Gottesmanbacteria bacterium GW2011_GWB1_44_11c]KKT46763.1 MAG: Crossover junction endodeoxyribonuclease RuvC [Candidatus Gottesmanbacteria bacterium GW2011_GWA2_44_17]KKT57312.1 MAG: Crossover junction endodeoxyribonuclease RuvC [Candidatus Gottesmanbacteria bacterium GW2011_GWA1_44_24b]HCM8
MVILGIDPGVARIGWGIIKNTKPDLTVIAYGLISTPKEIQKEMRLKSLYDAMLSVFTKYQPDIMSVEDLFFAANAKTAISVGEARGVILLSAAQKRVSVVSYTPLAVKRTITGDGHADKKQVEKMIVQILRLKKTPEIDDTTDALAIAATHAYTNENLKSQNSNLKK